MRTILVGYDGTRPAERALWRAAELAKAFDSKVVVVTVATPLPLPKLGAFGLLPYYAYGAEELKADLELWQQHRERVQAFFVEAGVAVEFTGAVGVPDEEIVQVAEQRQADLIVVGTHEPGFIERLLVGSVSEGVARRARCDVLIVHPPSEEEA